MSITIASLFVLVVNQFLPDVSQSDLEATIRTILSIVTPITAYFGRYRIGDINWFGKRV